ncbi:MAG TPA: radical SAM protein [Chthoniobacterales bacterium]|nr:radical SAM protein [Chthoniobacterales bacterium]
MAAPTGVTRIFQVHPLRTCNLRCLHCYSESAPGQRERLPAELIWEAISAAAAEGYDVVGFSGGEPLLYEPLGELLAATRDLGLRLSVTTNGMLLDERRIGWLRDGNCLVAISLDGQPDSHNRMRGSPRAFESMQDRLPLLREAGIAFGFIFTLTQFNSNELEWVAAFAREQGAQLLQVHALEVVGRAEESLEDAAPDGHELAVAFVETTRLQAEAGDGIVIHFDLLDRDFLVENPAAFFATPRPADAVSRPFAESISPLILEADGTVVPLGHGFPRAFALGNLRTAPLPKLIRDWRATREVEFRRVCQGIWEEAREPAEWPFINWYSEVRRRAANWKIPTTN